ncbi:MAG: DUF4135 domain-containing protein [Clostridiales bacterium]|nr:DUF4135 domain-containing protein [Clostridiales bacterium]
MNNHTYEHSAPLGDKHNGGRAVTLKYLDDGTPVICKPRNAKTEMAFAQLLNGYKNLGLSCVPNGVEVLFAGEKYNEQAYVHHLPARSEEDVRKYFFNCGVTVFLTYMLGSYDLHCENIIASLDSPVIIDLETLLSAEIVKRNAAYGVADLSESVLKSHLLPNWIALDSEMRDCSGFSGALNGSKNILFYNNDPQMAYIYADTVISGFEKAYELSLKNRERIKDLIEKFGDCTFRQLLRPTDVYDKIIRFCAAVDDMQSRRSAAYALLARAYENDIDPNRIKKAEKLLRYEIESVLQGDIPLFVSHGNSINLYNCDEETLFENFYCKSPVECAISRLYSLNEADMKSQTKIIIQALSAAKPVTQTKTCVSEKLDNISLVFDILEKYVIPAISSKWMLLDFGRADSLFLQSAGLGIYNGLLGILCFYAAAYYRTGQSKYLEKLFDYYSSYRKITAESIAAIPLSDDSCSFSNGMGGQLSALYHIYELTGQKIFYNDFINILNRISLQNVNIKNTEIMGGAVSLALVLPKADTPIAKDIAGVLAPYLLQAKPTLTGMAHGAAGLSLALSAIGAVLNSNDYDEKISELLAFENSYYFEDEGNWQDLRYESRKSFMLGWCAGAPGIAMARKRMLEYTRNSAIAKVCEDDIKRASRVLGKADCLKRDSLCCGNSAILAVCSFLGLENSQIFAELESRLRTLSLNMYHPLDTCDINCGLMQGFAGVGYALAMYGDPFCGGMMV